MIAPAPISTLRLALRIANAFTLDLLTIYRGDRDFTDALILAALMQRKAVGLAGEPEHLRGAISINALAVSLGLPFETVRRRSKRLIAEGLCEAAADGIRISTPLLASEAHHEALHAAYETAQTLYLRLVRANCIQLMSLPPPVESALPDGGPPVRIVWRATVDYFLRIMELLLPHFSHLTQAFVLQAVAAGNTAELPDTMRGEDRMDVDALVPDSYRKPVRASEVAKRLGAPHETVRRNLAGLVEEGRCKAVQGGFIVPAAVLAQGTVAAAYAPNFQNLRRMFMALADAGVLARWEGEREAPESAA